MIRKNRIALVVQNYNNILCCCIIVHICYVFVTTKFAEITPFRELMGDTFEH